MSSVLILKVSDDQLSEDEGIEIIKSIAENFGLRVTIGDRKRDEDQRFDIMDLLPAHEKDLAKSIEKGNLVPLIDEEAGIIGYLLDGNEDEILGHLNGNRNHEVF